MKRILIFIIAAYSFLAQSQTQVTPPTTFSKPQYIVLDVRTPSEFEKAHLESAVNVDVQSDNFKEVIAKYDKSLDYKVYCRSGRRSGNAIDIMKQMGFKKLENLGSLGDAKIKLQSKCVGADCKAE